MSKLTRGTLRVETERELQKVVKKKTCADQVRAERKNPAATTEELSDEAKLWGGGGGSGPAVREEKGRTKKARHPVKKSESSS